jgi:hypothetical protein
VSCFSFSCRNGGLACAAASDRDVCWIYSAMVLIDINTFALSGGRSFSLRACSSRARPWRTSSCVRSLCGCQKEPIVVGLDQDVSLRQGRNVPLSSCYASRTRLCPLDLHPTSPPQAIGDMIYAPLLVPPRCSLQCKTHYNHNPIQTAVRRVESS